MDGGGNTTQQNEQSVDALAIEQSVKPSQAFQRGPKTFEEMFGENESSVATPETDDSTRGGGSSRIGFSSIFRKKGKKEDGGSSVNLSHTTGGSTFSS